MKLKRRIKESVSKGFVKPTKRIKSNRYVASAYFNGSRYTHPDFQTSFVGGSVKRVLFDLCKELEEWSVIDIEDFEIQVVDRETGEITKF